MVYTMDSLSSLSHECCWFQLFKFPPKPWCIPFLIFHFLWLFYDFLWLWFTIFYDFLCVKIFDQNNFNVFFKNWPSFYRYSTNFVILSRANFWWVFWVFSSNGIIVLGITLYNVTRTHSDIRDLQNVNFGYFLPKNCLLFFFCKNLFLIIKIQVRRASGQGYS